MANEPNRIAELRKQKGWSQERLGQEVGTDKTVVSKLERGLRRLDETWLKKLARAFDVGPGEILSGADHTFTQASTKVVDRLGGWPNIAIEELDVRAGAGGTFAMDSELESQDGQLIERVGVVNEWQMPSDIFAPITSSRADSRPYGANATSRKTRCEAPILSPSGSWAAGSSFRPSR